MPRPVKWSRDVHPIRERAQHSRIETWSRQDIEHLFDISRPSAQNLMKAIGEVQVVGGAHFVDRASLLAFLDAMILADSIESALADRLAQAAPPPRPKPLRIALPDDLRHAMMPDLPANITLGPGRIAITAETPTGLAEALLILATIMQNDLQSWELAVGAEGKSRRDVELDDWLKNARRLRQPA